MGDKAISVALARSRIYRLLSTAFLYPEGDFLALFEKDLEEGKGLLEDGGGLREALAALGSSLADLPLQDLQAEHRRIFSHVISKECPPYEAQYGSSHVFQQAQILGDIAGFYRAFGLEVSDQAKDRLDHIAVELEFMHFLAYKEAYALIHQGEEAATLCREAQRKFFQEHLGRWAPLFLRLLEGKAQEGFYRKLASSALAFLEGERKHLGVTPLSLSEGDGQSPTLSPSGEESLKSADCESEGACFSCG